MKKEIATFGAGCFWHVQEEFDKVPGVIKTTVGYAGGKTKNPTYEDVCTSKTGHAETVQVEFDPQKISYQDLLKFFFRLHNPTEKNRQGPDIGTQYRSIVFYHNVRQKKLAEETKKEVAKRYDSPIVTEIVKAGPFYEAEAYHQKYLEKKGCGTCKIK